MTEILMRFLKQNEKVCLSPNFDECTCDFRDCKQIKKGAHCVRTNK